MSAMRLSAADKRKTGELVDGSKLIRVVTTLNAENVATLGDTPAVEKKIKIEIN